MYTFLASTVSVCASVDWGDVNSDINSIGVKYLMDLNVCSMNFIITHHNLYPEYDTCAANARVLLQRGCQLLEGNLTLY